MAAGLTCGLSHWNGLAVACGSVYYAEQIVETSAGWEWSDDVNVDVLEAFVRERKLTHFGPDSAWLGALTGVAGSGEVFGLSFELWPVIEFRDPPGSFFSSGMSNSMECLQDDLAQLHWDHWTRFFGHFAVNVYVVNLMPGHPG